LQDSRKYQGKRKRRVGDQRAKVKEPPHWERKESDKGEKELVLEKSIPESKRT